jgi:hypothetical protein
METVKSLPQSRAKQTVSPIVDADEQFCSEEEGNADERSGRELALTGA